MESPSIPEMFLVGWATSKKEASARRGEQWNVDVAGSLPIPATRVLLSHCHSHPFVYKDVFFKRRLRF